jgi:nicotinic acid phosphoribosyltransferase
VRAEGLDALLDSPLGRRVAATPEEDLASLLLNDAYKPKMHRLYAMFYGGVTADFVLNVRRTPFPLKRIRAEVCCARGKLLTVLAACAYLDAAPETRLTGQMHRRLLSPSGTLLLPPCRACRP